MAVASVVSRWVNSHSPSATSPFAPNGRAVAATGTSGAAAMTSTASGLTSRDNSLVRVHSSGDRRWWLTMPPTWSTSIASGAIVGAPFSGLIIPPAGMEATQPCGPSSNVTMPNRPNGVFNGCDIGIQRDWTTCGYIPPRGI